MIWTKPPWGHGPAVNLPGCKDPIIFFVACLTRLLRAMQWHPCASGGIPWDASGWRFTRAARMENVEFWEARVVVKRVSLVDGMWMGFGGSSHLVSACITKVTSFKRALSKVRWFLLTFPKWRDLSWTSTKIVHFQFWRFGNIPWFHPRRPSSWPGFFFISRRSCITAQDQSPGTAGRDRVHLDF